MKEIRYKIDTTPFAEIGIEVSASSGVIDRLSMKTPYKTNNSGEHGEDTDLSEQRFDRRLITLHCWMVAASNIDLIRKKEAVIGMLSPARLLRLQIDVLEVHPLLFDVYCSDGIQFDKEWLTEDGEIVSTFSIKLIEPQPVKKIYLCDSTDVSIECQSRHPLLIGWGDCTYTKYIYDAELSHSYQDGEDRHYIILAGVFDEYTIINTNIDFVCNNLG